MQTATDTKTPSIEYSDDSKGVTNCMHAATLST